jgi:carbonic anhydrase
MRTQRDHGSEPDLPHLARRGFFKLAGAMALGLGSSARSEAAEISTSPKLENVLTPEAALERLLKGNDRYVTGKMKRHDFVSERPALALGQNPFAGILGCADSRVGPEYAFDAGRGDLFVCRVAGNFADDETIASFEFAVSVLGTPLLLVLGHSDCGAVKAAVNAVRHGQEFPGHIPSLIKALRPAVNAAQDQPGDRLANTIRQNVVINVEKLKTARPILSKAVEQRKLTIVGGIYSLETGRVALIA